MHLLWALLLLAFRWFPASLHASYVSIKFSICIWRRGVQNSQPTWCMAAVEAQRLPQQLQVQVQQQHLQLQPATATSATTNVTVTSPFPIQSQIAFSVSQCVARVIFCSPLWIHFKPRLSRVYQTIVRKSNQNKIRSKHYLNHFSTTFVKK